MIKLLIQKILAVSSADLYAAIFSMKMASGKWPVKDPEVCYIKRS
jgi:hypothetical protein